MQQAEEFFGRLASASPETSERPSKQIRITPRESQSKGRGRGRGTVQRNSQQDSQTPQVSQDQDQAMGTGRQRASVAKIVDLMARLTLQNTESLQCARQDTGFLLHMQTGEPGLIPMLSSSGVHNRRPPSSRSEPFSGSAS